MLKGFLLILIASLVYASDELANMDQPGLGPTPLSSCQVGSNFKVNTATITNFPPSSTTLNTFLNVTVLNNQFVEEYALQLTSGNGKANQVIVPFYTYPPPGSHFHPVASINIPGPVQENFNLKMIISNGNENTFCYQMTFAIWNVS